MNKLTIDQEPSNRAQRHTTTNDTKQKRVVCERGWGRTGGERQMEGEGEREGERAPES